MENENAEYVRRNYGAGMEALLRDILNEDLHAETAATLVEEIEDFLEDTAEEITMIKPSTAAERAAALEIAKAASRRVRSAYVPPRVSRPLPPRSGSAPLDFPQVGLGSQNPDPVKAAEYIARLQATHAPGGTQNRPGMSFDL